MSIIIQKDLSVKFLDVVGSLRRKATINDLVTIMKNFGVVEIDDKTYGKLRAFLKRYEAKKESCKVKNIIDWDKLLKSLCNDEIICQISKEELMEIDDGVTLKEKRKGLDVLKSEKQLRERTDDIYEKVQEKAVEEGVTVDRLLGLLLSRSRTKWIREKGKQVWNDKPNDNNDKLPVEVAATVYTDGQFGRNTYSQMRKILAASGHKVFPAWRNIREFQRSLTPETRTIPEPNKGIYFELKESCKITASRILQQVNWNVNKGSPLRMQIKFGFDGSGGHALYNQKNNVNTNNMILAMFCPLLIRDSEDNVIWEQKTPNAATAQRPLLLQKGKESTESLQSVSVFNHDIETLSKDGIVVVCNNVAIDMTVSISSYMMDRKAADIYTGLGGAYCDLCNYSKEECLDVELVEKGFNITRDIKNMIQIFNDLEDEDGSIKKKKNDYAVRAGQTNRPIATNDVNSVQVLHAVLRCFDHYMKVVVHTIAGVFEWSESKTSINNAFLQNTKEALRDKIKLKTGQQWDMPNGQGQGGTTTTGKTAKILLFQPETRDFICSLIQEGKQDILKKYGFMLSVILQVMSSDRLVNIEKYREYCAALNVFLLTNFTRIKDKHLPGPWISITPSLHKVLAHSWELIEANEGKGLKRLDECGLEANNKVLRHLRTKLSRKCDEASNMVDSLQRMWFSSDPIIAGERIKGQPFCKECKESGHSKRYCAKKYVLQTAQSEEKTVVDSFFV